MKTQLSSLLALSLLILGPGAALAQGLPNTNMGKFIHQPGDNQYTIGEQVKRHGSSGYIDTAGGGRVIIRKVNQGGGGGAAPVAVAPVASAAGPIPMGGALTLKTDISVEPISADEPVPPAGFPPLPERLDLPIGAGAGWGKEMARGGGGGGYGGGGGMGGGGGRSGGPPQTTGVHQHYKHYQPGAFNKKNQDGGGGGGGGGYNEGGGGGGYSDAAVPGVGEGGGGGGYSDGGGGGGGGGGPAADSGAKSGGSKYYKCGTPAPIRKKVNMGEGGDGPGSGMDTFSANSSAPPKYKGASNKSLKSLGPEPMLDNAADLGGVSPEAPKASMVSQSVSQDLSLPDDEFASRYGTQGGSGKRFAKRMGKTIGGTGLRIIRGAASRGF